MNCVRVKCVQVTCRVKDGPRAAPTHVVCATRASFTAPPRAAPRRVPCHVPP